MRNDKAPSWLDSTGKAFWKKLGPLLDLSNDNTREQLAMLCDNWSIWTQSTKRLQTDGLTVELITGGEKAHPCLLTKWRAQGEIRKLSKTLGLDVMPVVEDTDEEEDDLDIILGD